MTEKYPEIPDFDEIPDKLKPYMWELIQLRENKKRQWIRTADRLPEKSGLYITMTESGIIDTMFYSAKHSAFNVHDWATDEDKKRYEIPCDYWMPLPDPPESEGNND